MSCNTTPSSCSSPPTGLCHPTAPCLPPLPEYLRLLLFPAVLELPPARSRPAPVSPALLSVWSSTEELTGFEVTSVVSSQPFSVLSMFTSCLFIFYMDIFLVYSHEMLNNDLVVLMTSERISLFSFPKNINQVQRTRDKWLPTPSSAENSE
ncbi:hypothetical protein XENOCAPTIV_004030 [Xenoophorus captivus]|uniref:Uncharacterized protein n=1 Tax=Xenoophorus captivus TaxID=1517983 RepID=A0ABV0QQZ1_9TELE